MTFLNGVKKPSPAYRVTLTATVEVEIEVEAHSESEARRKAFGWDSGYASGSCKTGSYATDEDVDVCDEGVMFWEITNVDPIKIVEVFPLED